MTGFNFVSFEFDPLDFLIDYPGGTSKGADWDLITDSDTLIALEGTLSVTSRNGNGNGPNGAVPEPEMLALFGLGLTGLAGAVRRRSSRRNTL